MNKCEWHNVFSEDCMGCLNVRNHNEGNCFCSALVECCAFLSPEDNDAALEVEAFLDIHARVSAFTESQDTSDLLMGALTLEGGA